MHVPRALCRFQEAQQMSLSPIKRLARPFLPEPGLGAAGRDPGPAAGAKPDGAAGAGGATDGGPWPEASDAWPAATAAAADAEAV